MEQPIIIFYCLIRSLKIELNKTLVQLIINQIDFTAKLGAEETGAEKLGAAMPGAAKPEAAKLGAAKPGAAKPP